MTEETYSSIPAAGEERKRGHAEERRESQQKRRKVQDVSCDSGEVPEQESCQPTGSTHELVLGAERVTRTIYWGAERVVPAIGKLRHLLL